MKSVRGGLVCCGRGRPRYWRAGRGWVWLVVVAVMVGGCWKRESPTPPDAQERRAEVERTVPRSAHDSPREGSGQPAHRTKGGLKSAHRATGTTPEPTARTRPQAGETTRPGEPERARPPVRPEPEKADGSGRTSGGRAQGDADQRLLSERHRGSADPGPELAWGMDLPGIVTHAGGSGDVVALTFDACGTHAGDSEYDAELIDYLRAEKVPATLFLSGKWIDLHPERAKELANDPLFEIGNHGLRHLPCSTTGRAAYGIKGTVDEADVRREVEENGAKIAALTGRKPHWFRAGTAHYDARAVEIIHGLGYEIAGFAVNGDGGATFKAETVRKQIVGATGGAIVLCHMNHPESGTAEGVKMAVEEMRGRGARFVTLTEGRR